MKASFRSGLAASVVAVAIAIAIWIAASAATASVLPLFSLVVGAAAGTAMRAAGRGTSGWYPATASLVALLGCLAGGMASQSALVAAERSTPYWEYVRSEPLAILVTLGVYATPLGTIAFVAAVALAYLLARHPKTS